MMKERNQKPNYIILEIATILVYICKLTYLFILLTVLFFLLGVSTIVVFITVHLHTLHFNLNMCVYTVWENTYSLWVLSLLIIKRPNCVCSLFYSPLQSIMHFNIMYVLHIHVDSLLCVRDILFILCDSPFGR